MGMFWLGVATPFLIAIALGVSWLLLQACHALANRLMRWAHGRLVSRHQLPLSYDDSHEWTAAEHRFTDALIRNGGMFWSFPWFGWQVCVVPDRPADSDSRRSASVESSGGGGRG